MTKPYKIDHRIWAQLQTGVISSVHHGRASLRYQGGSFVMSAVATATHWLSATETDAQRLDAHWQSYATEVEKRLGLKPPPGVAF